MIAVNYNQFNKNMKSYIDNIFKTCEPLLIKGEEKNVVIISEEVYNNLLENIYLTKEKANYDWLIESKNQLNR